MIYIYTEKKDSNDWILQNDLYFNLNTSNEEMSQYEINLIQKVDEAKLTPDKHIETKYGLGTIRNLSSGCKTLQYLVGFKRYSTERVMKSLVGEFTQNEKWSVKGALMGECWYKDCCVSEHLDNLRCGKPEVEGGAEKMRILIWSEKVHKIMSTIIV